MINFETDHRTFGECDIGWLARENGMCYRKVEAQPKVGWADAQDQCNQMQANLASIHDKNDYDYMSTQWLVPKRCDDSNMPSDKPNFSTLRDQCTEFFGQIPSHSWIGYTDADDEGALMGINSKSNTIWPQPILPDNNDERDCLYLDYSMPVEEPYRIADCRTKQSFICQKRNNWSTFVVGPQHERVRTAFFKKQCQNRIHSTESNRLVRGIDTHSQFDHSQPKDALYARINYQDGKHIN
ncbi:hypothetical protein DICVIV_10589 [Dictyocaulus viviparus]|uniref:C-type lectin domain-containing protein n=1 Tax=Dictyocaulus viviparus TaxID=29172 RepID=A0A0D8XI36_DICVI|nr:hypothetical protein DICVIV_10589 [Dictyocaulus viviparus]